MPIDTNLAREVAAVGTSRSYIASNQSYEEETDSVVWPRYHVSRGYQNTEDACVNRCDVRFDSSYSRLLQWVIYSRNVSAETKEVERRACPLLWCRQIYPSEQQLVEHIRSCVDMWSDGEYWCSICSKPEQYLHKFSQEPPLHRASHEEIRINLVTRAKEMLSVLGIGSVNEVSRRMTTLPTHCPSPSGSYKLATSCTSELDSDRAVSEPGQTHSFPASVQQPAHSFPSRKPVISSRRGFQKAPIQSRGQSQDASQFSGTCFPRRPINKQRYASQIPSLIASLSEGRTTIASLSLLDTPVNDRRSNSRLAFRQESIHEESILPTSSMDCSVDSSLGLTHPLFDRDLDENGPTLLSLFDSMAFANLVELFWDVLQEHVLISRGKIAQLHEIVIPSFRPLISMLMSMSSGAIAREGFHALQLMLAGTEPTTIPKIYSFVHVAYTSSVVLWEGVASANLKEMFASLFTLGKGLESNLEKKIFEKVVTAVWSVPIEADSSVDPSAIRQSLYSEPPIPTNSLVQACTRFLDRVERSRPVNLYASSSLQHSPKTPACQNDEFRTVVKLDVTVPLISTFTLECFIRDVASVERRSEEGHINNIRQLELELMWVTKKSSKSEVLYNRFLKILFESCDRAHNRLFQCGLSRTNCHLEDATTVLKTISSIEEDQLQSMASLSKKQSRAVGASPISFSSPTRNSSPCDSLSSPSFTFSPPTSTSIISNASSCSNVPSPPTQGTSSLSTSLSTSSSSTRALKCPICGYEPDPYSIQKWKAGNLKRHMRSTHNGKRYECTFEGCGKVFIGRKDNLLSHQRDKGHLPPAPSPIVTCEDDFVMDDVYGM